MTTKTLLSVALIALAPIAATADDNSGTIIISEYAPVDIANGDDEHIASTAYVKGAYNEAMEKLDNLNRTKQSYLINDDLGTPMHREVISAETFIDTYIDTNDIPEDAELDLVSAAAVASGIKSQRVEIYTTWDDDDETTEVPLIAATAQQ